MQEQLVIEGDIFNYIGNDVYICHQCNTTSKSGRGIARAIFDKYPNADVYKTRHKKGEFSGLGSIDIFNCKEGENSVNIVNIYAQKVPGYPAGTDSRKSRELLFDQGLEKLREHIMNLQGRKTVIFPYNIGCNLAGGDWTIYHKMLVDFAEKIKENAEVIIVRKVENVD